CEGAWMGARRRPAAAALLLVSAVATLALVGAGVGFAYSLRLTAEKARTEQALEKAERYQYFDHIARVNAGWRDGDLSQAEKLLAECPEDQRHWEWRYLTRLCRADLLTLAAHTGRAIDAAFSPDGTKIVSAGEDRMVKLWDAQTGEPVGTFLGHNDVVSSVAFSPDGRRIASKAWDGRVVVWDVSTRRGIPGCEGQRGAGAGRVAFSPDGARLAATTFGAPLREVWDMATGQLLAPLPSGMGTIREVAFSPDGTRIALGVDNPGMDDVEIWDATA